MSVCPRHPDEVAEDYCLNRLSPEIERAFEDHYILCPSCAKVVESTQDFLMTFRLLEGASVATEPPQARS